MEAFAGLQELPPPARPSLEAAGFDLRTSESPEVAAEHEAVAAFRAPARAGGGRGAAAARGDAPPPRRETRAAAAAAEGAQQRPRRVTRQALAPPPKPARRAGELRCIDDTHSTTCTSCTAPPELEQEDAFMLLGAEGKKNGEKRLRSLLVRTPEWKDEAMRARVIAACTTPRLEALARVFRGQANCSELRKAHVLYLARVWQYKSDIWVRRNKRAAGDGGSDVSDDSAAAAAALPPRKRLRAPPPATVPEDAEDAADAAADLPLDWARVTPPSPPDLPDGGGSGERGGGGGGARRKPRGQPRAGGSPDSPPLEAMMLPLAGLMLPAGVAAARALTTAKRGRPAVPPQPAAAAHARALQMPPAAGVAVCAAEVAAIVASTLMPLAGRCALYLSGGQARAACAAAPVAGSTLCGGAEFISQRVLTETRLAAAGWQALHADMQRSLAPQRAWSAQLAGVAGIGGGGSAFRASGASGGPPRRVSPRRAATQDGAAAAWGALLGRELPMEGLVRQVLTLVGSSAAFTCRRDADARTHGGSDVETAWLDEIAQAHSAMMLLCAHVQALVNGLKLSTMSDFLEGSTALLEAMVTAARAAADGWSARAEWLAAMLAERQRRALPHEADAVRATAASRPLLLLAFGGAAYTPLQFVPAGEDVPAAGAYR